MSWSLVAHTSATLTNTGSTSGITTTGADLIIVGATNYAGGGGAGRTLSDSKGNTWTPLTAQSGSVPMCQLYYCQAPTVGSGHTFTLTNSFAFYGTIWVQAWSGSATSSFDVQNGALVTSGVSSGQPGSITPSQNGELLIFLMGTSDGMTAPYTMNNSFTQPDSGIAWASSVTEGGGMGYLVQTTAAAINPTAGWSGSNSFGTGLAIAAFAPASGGSITGTLSDTLSAATLSAAGTVLVSGTLAETVSATLSAAGKVLVSGTLSDTLSAATLSAAGTVSSNVTGTLTATPAATLSATGTVLVSGTLTETVSATLSAAGTVLVSGTLSTALADATLSAAGTVSSVSVTGTLAETLSGATLSAAGTVLVSGTLTETLSAATLSATGKVLVSGTLAITLPAATVAATGFVGSISGTLSHSLPAATLFAQGVVGIVVSTLRGQPLRPYLPQPLPLIAGGALPYTQRELQRVSVAIGDAQDMSTVASTAAPRKLRDGMWRLARKPWWPVAGQTQDAWVYYDAAEKAWRYIHTDPTTT